MFKYFSEMEIFNGFEECFAIKSIENTPFYSQISSNTSDAS